VGDLNRESGTPTNPLGQIMGAPVGLFLGQFALLTSRADAGFCSQAILAQIVGVPVRVSRFRGLGISADSGCPGCCIISVSVPQLLDRGKLLKI
jgi:hypothetical protein